MESFYIKELIVAIDGQFIIGDPSLLVKGISIDSRVIKKDEVYFAIKGNNYDGHDFIEEAIKMGASSVVYSRDDINLLKYVQKIPALIKVKDTLAALGNFAKRYKTKFQNVKVVGITGSNGKTTTKEMLNSILNIKGKTVSNSGNFNNRIGLPLSIFNLNSDTKYGVFEIGTSLHGEVEVLTDILKPDCGIITNIGESHLKTFISPKGVYKEKKVLFSNVKESGFIVINNDDKFLRIAPDMSRHKFITFALDSVADVYAKNLKLYPDKTVFTIFHEEDSIKISIPSKGRFNVANALAAASCAIGFGFSLEDIKKGIESFTLPKMRMETLITSQGVVLINDAYNANPSSVREAIRTVIESYNDKKINLVLGDMLELGDKSLYYHLELGKFINNFHNINSVTLLGEMSFYTKKNINNKRIFYTKDPCKLIENLKRIDVDSNSVFLFKGSRGMRLENIYIELLDILEKER
ncbi:MAG: UDP-N-acetylmuramoyl-tripeptide--D-alanyl-D-alanine ligase [Endomicrobium sp.]|jgi:UDP-N-acetylmuramoyl-tripeptide--D-alanyl-D-alanine ligase|nr:UDP-N-acetylmuramoyl-tripeptide--D-alanyl-D-alanine ligase [Endomicrobium sp.]